MRIKRPMCVLCVLFVLIMKLFLSISGGVNSKIYFKDNRRVTAIGIVEDKVCKNNKYSIHLKKCRLMPSKESFFHEINKGLDHLIVYIDYEEFEPLKIGQIVEAEGAYQNFSKPENDGQFDAQKYYRIRGYEASVVNAQVLKVSKSYSKYREWLYRLKENTKQIFSSNMSENEAYTLCAMVLGDKSGINADVKNLYQAAGISHVLSLSGLHIATVGICLFSIFTSVGIGILGASICSAFIMISYGIMTGMSTSTIRALIMFFLAIIAKNIGRTYDILSGVCLSSILILFENPYYVYDAGFLMSVSAVAGIAMLQPALFDITEIKLRGSSRFIRIMNNLSDNGIFTHIRGSIVVSLSVTLATLPVAMNSFFKISRYSILVNIIVVPLMGILLGLGIIAAFIGNIFVRVPLCTRLVRAILMAAEVILKFYSALSEKCVEAYGNTWVIGKGNQIQISIYIIMLMLVYLYTQARMNSRNKRDDSAVEMLSIGNGRKQNIAGDGQKLLREARWRIGIVLTLISAVFIVTYRNTPDLSINVLSVGQGACNVICGKNIPTVMIDGGSTDVKAVGKYRIEPFVLSKGIDEIDYLFVSHPDADHVSGIKEMLEDYMSGIRIRHLFMSVYDEEIFNLAKLQGVDTHIMSAGDEISVKNVLAIKCISPERTESNRDVNDLSLVLRVDYWGENRKFSALFPGDISSDVEKKIIENDRALLNTDLLCLPHHGSRFSSCEEFLTAVNPIVSTISAGKNNSYGHPHKETLERLDKFVPGSKVIRTDEVGQITITVRGDKAVTIKQFKERSKDDK